jgi:hypothetical protein
MEIATLSPAVPENVYAALCPTRETVIACAVPAVGAPVRSLDTASVPESLVPDAGLRTT